MAIRSLRGARPFVGGALQRAVDGSIPPSELDRLMYDFQFIRSILNGGVSVGSGVSSTIAGNLKGQFVDWKFGSAADTVAIIAHGLGVVPVFAIPVLKDRACDVYDSNFGAGWGTNQIQLFCTVASAKVKLLIMA